ncbi:heme-degrading protein [Trinickia symbiotica]|nr:heme-degrading protein [Trinickia symbiotica]
MTSPIISTTTISLEAAQALMAEARRACDARGFAATIAITDAGGHLRAFERADTAPFLTVDVAIDKAWTAASFGMSTHQWNQYMAEPAVAPLAPSATDAGRRWRTDLSRRASSRGHRCFWRNIGSRPRGR